MTLSNFKHTVFDLLKKNSQVLAFVRIPNAANTNYYFFLKSMKDVESLLNNSNPSDSITIFKSIDILDSGIITEAFIKTILTTTSNYSFDPELVVTTHYNHELQKEDAEHEYAESTNQLKEVLTKLMGIYITLIKEPDFLDDENTFHIYVPDKNGISKPGHSY
ncbi:hypothetical protein [uncultured Kordia sp.]|uniref:hypothetical protein n=1 Tax=uncultured Kordia sp. TaxID=507699 RepID=UPI00262A6C3A|nr:hypothetical protein [uncultured Kordia sp.]